MEAVSEEFKRIRCCSVRGSLDEGGVVVVFEETPIAEDGFEQLVDDADEVAGGEAIGIIDQLFQLAEIELLDGVDPALKDCEWRFIGGDVCWNWFGVDVVIDQGLITTSDIGYVVGTFGESSLNGESHNCCWPKSHNIMGEWVG